MEEAIIAEEAKTGGDPLEGTRGGEAFQDRDRDGVEFAGDLPVMIDVVAVVEATIREGIHLVEEVAPEVMSENMIGGEALRTRRHSRGLTPGCSGPKFAQMRLRRPSRGLTPGCSGPKPAQMRPSIQVRVTVGPARRPDVITDGEHHLNDDVHHLREGAHHLREEDQ